jgi:O-antigen ligase
MDWNGILGIVIALGIITLVFRGAQPLMDYLERFFERSKTQDDLEWVDQTLKERNTPMLAPTPSATPGKNVARG